MTDKGFLLGKDETETQNFFLEKKGFFTLLQFSTFESLFYFLAQGKKLFRLRN